MYNKLGAMINSLETTSLGKCIRITPQQRVKCGCVTCCAGNVCYASFLKIASCINLKENGISISSSIVSHLQRFTTVNYWGMDDCMGLMGQCKGYCVLCMSLVPSWFFRSFRIWSYMVQNMQKVLNKCETSQLWKYNLNNQYR